MKNLIASSMITAVVLSSSLSISSPALAQEVAPVTPEAVCMTGLEGRVAQVPLTRQGQPFEIVVSSDDIDSFASKGFVVAACDSQRADETQWQVYRDEVCSLAAFGNDAVQNQLSRAFGEYPATLCRSVEKVAGEWNGRSEQFFTPVNYRKADDRTSPTAPETDQGAE